MGRPRKEERPEDTVKLLLRAAEDAFGANGFRDTRLGDIAETVGIRRSSLLYHFGSKEKLHSMVVETAFSELHNVLISAMDPTGTLEVQLDGLVECLLDFAVERPGLVCVILRQMVDPRGEGREQIGTAFTELVNAVETMYRAMAGARLREEFPVRSAIVQLITSYLVRVASGPLASLVWGEEDQTQVLARHLLLSDGALKPE
ncbi:MAG: TetR/AcrR family transcriptional regulator [Bradymonadia bacterium]